MIAHQEKRANARWYKGRAGWALYLRGSHRYIEYRPKLKLFDVMKPDGMRLGYGRTVPEVIVRTNSLFIAITWALRDDKPDAATRRAIYATAEIGKLL